MPLRAGQRTRSRAEAGKESPVTGSQETVLSRAERMGRVGLVQRNRGHWGLWGRWGAAPGSSGGRTQSRAGSEGRRCWRPESPASGAALSFGPDGGLGSLRLLRSAGPSDAPVFPGLAGAQDTEPGPLCSRGLTDSAGTRGSPREACLAPWSPTSWSW